MRTACVNPARIFDIRSAAGLTQADVTYRIRQHGHKANERSIRRWESGQHAPHANVVPALADALGVTIEALYQRDESDDEEEDEVHLLRIAHVALDKGEHQMAIDLIGRVKTMNARRRSKEDALT